jgi:hypothetical protein
MLFASDVTPEKALFAFHSCSVRKTIIASLISTVPTKIARKASQSLFSTELFQKFSQ